MNLPDFASDPELSIVIAVRNDNYGGDFNLRLENMLKWNIRLFEIHQIRVEFILVNYNPVSENKPLSEVIQFPLGRKFCSIRIITVDPSIHFKLCIPSIRKTVPVFEYIAKNAGIRRANGDFILSANPDILLPPRFFLWLSSRPLKKQNYYRTDRCDFHSFGVLNPEEERVSLKKITDNIFRIFLKGATEDIPEKSFSNFKLWNLRRKNGKRIRKNFWLLKNENYAKEHSLPVNYDNLTDRFHCNCSGDFMLMHKDHWFALNAYPENTFLSIHTDALFVVTAATNGLTEVLLKWPIFHQDHLRRYSGENSPHDFEILRMFRFFIDEGEKMLKSGKPRIFNDEFWGLLLENLHEEFV